MGLWRSRAGVWRDSGRPERRNAGTADGREAGKPEHRAKILCEQEFLRLPFRIFVPGIRTARMATEKGYRIEVSSPYEEWWRYNVELMCGCFDPAGNRIGFTTAESRVADVGSNLTTPPSGITPDRRAVLEAPVCDHLLLYIYIIPHTLPASNDIEATKPFPLDLLIECNGKRLLKERRTINQWSGASIELKVSAAGVE